MLAMYKKKEQAKSMASLLEVRSACSIAADMAVAAATPAWAVLAYLVAGVFFILALRGLSSARRPASAGNRYRHDRHGDRGGDDAGHP